jgi:hypothetical protein
MLQTLTKTCRSAATEKCFHNPLSKCKQLAMQAQQQKQQQLLPLHLAS